MSAPADLFAGGGEMGAIMRSTDWSKTKLGPVEQWPRSLRTMLGVVLGILTAGSMANLPQQQLTKATGGTPTFKQVTLDYRAPQIPTLGSAPTA